MQPKQQKIIKIPSESFIHIKENKRKATKLGIAALNNRNTKLDFWKIKKCILKDNI